MVRKKIPAFVAILSILSALSAEKALEPSALKEGGLFKLWKSMATVRLEFPAENTAKVYFPDADSSGGIVSDPVPVKAGAYTLTFKTRGKGRLNAHFTQFDEAKKMLSREIQDLGELGSEWSAQTKTIAVSNGASFITLNFLFYKNTGEFEIAGIFLERKADTGGAAAPSGGPHQEPVGLWSFDESDRSGITVYDRQGSSHADLAEGAVFVAGRNGGAVSFDGVTGAVLCDQAPFLGQNFTITAWFKSDDLANGQHTVYAGDTKGCHYFRVNPDGALALIRADVKVAGISKQAVRAGTWQHLAVTYVSNGGFQFFVDGEDAGSGKAEHADFVNAQHASLGAVSAGAVPRAMKGELDEVRVYDRALSPSEIASLAQHAAMPSESKAHRAARRAPTLTIRLKGDATWNWFEFGKPVRFSPGGGFVPEEIESLQGAITLADGKEFATVTVTRDELRSKGWIFQPSHPGYYQVSFSF
ncbi:MAG: LamG domain-containing protein, partial [Spirochaetia bacterium]|nr:LamG domain-containing protein [Spirochaetia bacterium]